MYYKKKGTEFPVIRAGSVYEKTYVYDGYIYFKYEIGNFPQEEMEKITEEEFKLHEPVTKEMEEEPTQLDRIEKAVNKSQQDIIDEYTLELIEGGVI